MLYTEFPFTLSLKFNIPFKNISRYAYIYHSIRSVGPTVSKAKHYLETNFDIIK